MSWIEDGIGSLEINQALIRKIAANGGPIRSYSDEFDPEVTIITAVRGKSATTLLDLNIDMTIVPKATLLRTADGKTIAVPGNIGHTSEMTLYDAYQVLPTEMKILNNALKRNLGQRRSRLTVKP
jgi:hypothetical protein